MKLNKQVSAPPLTDVDLTLGLAYNKVLLVLLLLVAALVVTSFVLKRAVLAVAVALLVEVLAMLVTLIHAAVHCKAGKITTIGFDDTMDILLYQEREGMKSTCSILVVAVPVADTYTGRAILG
jgi:hypothetical protein